jgi:beta-N-acetylhexosaminidase
VLAAAGVLAAPAAAGAPAAPAMPGPPAVPGPPARAAMRPDDAHVLGQRIMVGFDGTVPPVSLLQRVRRGEVGSVILFAGNISSRPQLRSLTGALQAAARAGGNPPLLIAVDQEGGQVKRLPAGPPYLSPPQMVARGSSALAAHEGRATGAYLRGLGINWDLAPVADVPSSAGAFIWQQGRAFSFAPGTVAAYAGAFAGGLQAAGVAATGKHFPGVGTAGVDTDNQLDALRPSRAQLEGALAPYRRMIRAGLRTVMVATAAFPSLDSSGAPAALSRSIIGGLLRRRLGFAGVAITDALGTPTGHDEVTAGVLAARAGADVLLYTDSASGELPALLRALRRGALSRADALVSYRRIVALKAAVAAT